MRNFIFIFVAFAALALQAQTSPTSTSIPDINRVEVRGNILLNLIPGTTPSLLVDLNGNEEKNYYQNISGQTLTIEGKGGDATIKVDLCAPSLNFIKLNSVANLKCQDQINLSNLEVESTGAIDADLNLNCQTLKINSSGASSIDVKGSGQMLDVKTSGAADLDARDFKVQYAIIKAEGASSTYIDATDSISINASGASDVTYMNEPAKVDLNVTGAADAGLKGGKKVSALDNIGEIPDVPEIPDVDDDSICKKEEKYNGHWAGVDLILSTYTNNAFSFNAPVSHPYLELEIPRSFGLQLNFFEQNVTLVDKKLGLTTGLGLQWVNYRFDDKVRLSDDSSSIFGYYDSTAFAKKSKLSALYLTLPLMLEYQTNAKSKKEQFPFWNWWICRIKNSIPYKSCC